MPETRDYTVGSLFAGIGGIDLGFWQAGFSISWAIEKDHDCCQTYRANIPNCDLLEHDIQKIDPSSLNHVDILVAGFPCQAFSIGGRQAGFQDSRGNLFFEIIRFIDVLQPRIIFLENVANLTQHDNGRTFQVIYNTLISQGYFLRYRVLRASEYSNIPQIRDRIYIVAFHSVDDCQAFRFPTATRLTTGIGDFLKTSAPAKEEYYYTDSSPFAQKARDIVKDTASIYRVYHGSIKPIRSSMCPTLTASMGTQTNQVPLIRDSVGVRKLTIRECLRFQGFPDTFGFPKCISQQSAYRQIGNTVCIPVVRRIAEEIIKILHKGSE